MHVFFSRVGKFFTEMHVFFGRFGKTVKIVFVARRVLNKYRAAFDELAEWVLFHTLYTRLFSVKG